MGDDARTPVEEPLWKRIILAVPRGFGSLVRSVAGVGEFDPVYRRDGLCFLLIVHLPAASFYTGQEAFAQVLGPVWQIFVGSLLGYLFGQTLNAWVMVAMKKASKGRFLWLRMIVSTLVGELLDTVIFCSIAAPVLGIDTMEAFINYVLIGYIYKCLVEVILMPISYPIIGWFKRHELEYVA